MESRKADYRETGRNYATLSLQDVLRARDQYHTFLTRKAKVVGTAAGRYRYYKDKGTPATAPKTLENSEVRRTSGPCLLVFVSEWILPGEFARNPDQYPDMKYDDFLPRELHLEDREVPICVIEAKWHPKDRTEPVKPTFPGSIITGGYPIFTNVQGEERYATLGCLVSDGRLIYGLTNSHVAGRPGEALYTFRRNSEVELGTSSDRLLRKKRFTEVYEGLPGKHSLLNADVGLVELHDLRDVSSQVFGIGSLTGLLDMNHDTLSLNLAGCHVRGYGCASGLMQGEIVGLFYRYTSTGGYDYVADYLIGPRDAKEGGGTLPFAPTYGDSGTLLVVDRPGDKDYDGKALALLWGGQEDAAGKNEQSYCLATNLGTICLLLDVQLVCDWNTSPAPLPYFGAYAHMLLPSLCAGVVKDTKLRSLMEANAEHLSLPMDTAPKETKGFTERVEHPFVPLSDVPDLVWKGSRAAFPRGKEGPNHFADMDQPNEQQGGLTLLESCEDESNIDPAFWLTFYEQVEAGDKGLLPFRIAQIYKEMVEAVTSKDVTRFVCAAGILPHYVFDAAMPLHISRLWNGDDSPNPKTVTNRKGEKVSASADVHTQLDNAIVERHGACLQSGLPSLVVEAAETDQPVSLDALTNMKDAATAAVALMRNTVAYAPPADIVADYADYVVQQMAPAVRSDRLWHSYGTGMMKAMAEAVVLVARLWEAAWKQGKGEAIPSGELGDVGAEALRELYDCHTGFLDSMNLKEIGPALGW